MFVAKNKVRMHDTDMAGILYFPRQFRFVHDAWEDWMESKGLFFDDLFRRNDFAFVVVHAEADYKKPLRVGDHLEVHVQVDHIGSTSFSIGYKIFKSDGSLAGTAKTIHVAVDTKNRHKITIPPVLREALEKIKKD